MWKKLLLLISALCFADGQNETAQLASCTEEWDAFCEREAFRICYVDEEGKNQCGVCMPEFVEWRTRCISQDQVDIVEFLEEYAPQFLEPISMEERAAFLIKTIIFIAEHNAKDPPPPYELAINMFSADSEADTEARLGFRSDLAGEGEEDFRQREPVLQSSGAPLLRVDHTELGHVTAVKDQGRCGCCWAVTTAGIIEGAVAVNAGYLQSLSFQQFISCDANNYGCNGGSLAYAMGYAWKTEFGGVARLADYEYSDYKGKTTSQCVTIGKEPAVAVLDAEIVVDFYDDFTFEERLQRMKDAVARQPVGVAIRSNCQTISNYRKGIITEDGGCSCDAPECADHAVLLVGYDDTTDPPSWKIKNSWSTGWGEDGYFRIAQTKKGNYGLFGILLHGVVSTQALNVTDDFFPEPNSASPTSYPKGATLWLGSLPAMALLYRCLL